MCYMGAGLMFLMVGGLAATSGTPYDYPLAFLACGMAGICYLLYRLEMWVDRKRKERRELEWLRKYYEQKEKSRGLLD